MLKPPDTNAERIGKAEVEPRELEGGGELLSHKESEWFETYYRSHQFDPEDTGSDVQKDPDLEELCNLESDDAEKENSEPRGFGWGHGLRRNALGVWVDTGFRPPISQCCRPRHIRKTDDALAEARPEASAGPEASAASAGPEASAGGVFSQGSRGPSTARQGEVASCRGSAAPIFDEAPLEKAQFAFNESVEKSWIELVDKIFVYK